MAQPSELMNQFLTDMAESDDVTRVMRSLEECRKVQGFEEACRAGALDACRIGSQTPLHVAASRGFDACVAALLLLGASPTLPEQVGSAALNACTSGGICQSYALRTTQTPLVTARPHGTVCYGFKQGCMWLQDNSTNAVATTL